MEKSKLITAIEKVEDLELRQELLEALIEYNKELLEKLNNF